MTHFYKGDKLKAVNVLDDDGEPCEGRLIMGEIVTMDDRSSECRPFIIVTRENGRQLHIEKTRFELHCRAGVMVLISNLCPEIPPPDVPDCMVGKTLQESLHILDQLSMKGPDWNTEIDGGGLLLFQMGKLSLDDYLKIRNRKENGLTEEECMTMINNGENK